MVDCRPRSEAPRVSVVMAVYNGASFLREAVDSVLQQTFADFEFVVVDDGSRDETPEILGSHVDRRLRVISQQNRGLAAALNVGVRTSRGEYIARLDADDLAARDRLERQVRFLDENPGCVLVGGFLQVITAGGQPIYLHTLPTSWQEIERTMRARRNPFLHPSVTFRRRSALECGLYNEGLASGQDFDLYKRLGALGEMRNLPVCVGHYRFAPRAISNQPRRVRRRRAEILRRAEMGKLTTEDRRFLADTLWNRDAGKRFSVYALRVGKAYQLYTEDVAAARQYLWQAVRSWSFNWPAWYRLLLAYIPRQLVLALERIRSPMP